jgi:hypothetical protein
VIDKIRRLKKIDTSSIVNNEFLIEKDGNIEIYYAPFDYINSNGVGGIFICHRHEVL